MTIIKSQKFFTNSVSACVVAMLIAIGTILSDITSVLAGTGKGFAGTFLVGLLFLGICMIIEAILGSIERDQLEKALE